MRTWRATSRCVLCEVGVVLLMLRSSAYTRVD
jgi:hypothetical protein